MTHNFFAKQTALGDAQQAVEQIIARHDKITYAVLFGSALRQLRRESDIDFLLGGELDFSQTVDLAAELEIVLKRRVDLVFSHKASPEVAMEAFSRGSAIFIRDKQKLKQDYFSHLYRFEDAQHLYQLRQTRLQTKDRHGSEKRDSSTD